MPAAGRRTPNLNPELNFFIATPSVYLFCRSQPPVSRAAVPTSTDFLISDPPSVPRLRCPRLIALPPLSIRDDRSRIETLGGRLRRLYRAVRANSGMLP